MRSMISGLPDELCRRITGQDAAAAGVTLYLADLDRMAVSLNLDTAADCCGEERERAGRFRSPELAKQFLAGRHFLRAVLSSHSGWPARELRMIQGPFGKPAVPGLPVEFNMAHSGAHALAGVSTAGPVGVDIETATHQRDCRGVAARCLGAGELTACNRPEENAFLDSFMRFWTLKEAILKASGEGLSRDMREIELSLAGPAPVIVRLPHSYGDPVGWRAGCGRLPDLRLWFAWARMPAGISPPAGETPQAVAKGPLHSGD